MAAMDARAERIVRELVGRLRRAPGGEPLSVTVYGSAVGGAYRPGRSDINAVVVCDALPAARLEGLRKAVARFCVRHLVRPLFVTPEFIASSMDVYAVEWAEIARRRSVAWGTDFFAACAPDPGAVRRQCERELRQNLLRFRQGLVFRGDPNRLLEESRRTVRVVLENLGEAGAAAPREQGEPSERAVRRRGRAAVSAACAAHAAYLERLVVAVDGREGA